MFHGSIWRVVTTKTNKQTTERGTVERETEEERERESAVRDSEAKRVISFTDESLTLASIAPFIERGSKDYCFR